MRNVRLLGASIGLTDQQKRYINFNVDILNDGQMSRKLKVSKNIIAYYRTMVLKVIKGRTARTVNFDGTMITIHQVNAEIKALQYHANYPSLMNGAHDRMKYLMSIKEGVRITC